MAYRIEVVHETTASTVATWCDVAILAVRTAITLDAVQIFVEASNRLARDRPACSLFVIGERTQLPEFDVLEATSAATRQSQAICGARVIPGHGLWATALRGMVNKAMPSFPSDRPRETFNSIQEATAWLAGTMGQETHWRLQLTTMAGTLVYGSPSWNRASQIQPYLSGTRGGTER